MYKKSMEIKPQKRDVQKRQVVGWADNSQLSSLSCHIVLQTICQISVFSPHEAYEKYFSTSNEHFCGYYDQIKCEKLQMRTIELIYEV
jgi:hypothetical protein